MGFQPDEHQIYYHNKPPIYMSQLQAAGLATFKDNEAKNNHIKVDKKASLIAEPLETNTEVGRNFSYSMNETNRLLRKNSKKLTRNNRLLDLTNIKLDISNSQIQKSKDPFPETTKFLEEAKQEFMMYLNETKKEHEMHLDETKEHLKTYLSETRKDLEVYLNETDIRMERCEDDWINLTTLSLLLLVGFPVISLIVIAGF